jgi:hypothetical protein
VKRCHALAALFLSGVSVPAAAGPPYVTDDPVPTDLGHWEIYAFTGGDGHRSTLDDETGVDLNYGGFKDVQLTATVPLGLSHDPATGWHGGTGDLELAAKYRFVHHEKSGVSISAFPRVILPTSTLAHGERTRLLLPVWAEKDFAGGTSLFGGGGYMLNPGPGNRNYWQAGVAVTQDVSDRLSLGAELARQGRDAIDSTARTDARVGGILKLSDHYALLASGGPTWSDHRTGYHFYAALGLFF